MLDLRSAHQLCRNLADSSRLRLLALLAHEPMTVAELCEVTQLGQSRVSTHLGKLKEAGLVRVERFGNASLYMTEEASTKSDAQTIWTTIRAALLDARLDGDLERAQTVVRARSARESWADRVAGEMDRHYSPGRTWESSARALAGLSGDLGDVLDVASGDGVMAELLAPSSQSVTCLDISDAVLKAAKRRLSTALGAARAPTTARAEIFFVRGDMHALPFEPSRFDRVLMMNALTYASDIQKVFSEAARVLRPGGTLVGVTLEKHEHTDTVRQYGHLNLGFRPASLRRPIERAGFQIHLLETTHEERRAPRFRVITFVARKPETPQAPAPAPTTTTAAAAAAPAAAAPKRPLRSLNKKRKNRS